MELDLGGLMEAARYPRVQLQYGRSSTTEVVSLL